MLDSLKEQLTSSVESPYGNIKLNAIFSQCNGANSLRQLNIMWKWEFTHDFNPAFSSVISSRLEDLLSVCKTCSVTSDPCGKINTQIE